MQLPLHAFSFHSRIPQLTLLSVLLLCTPTTAEDCNNNGIEDTTDITNGTSQDCNENGIPDECDLMEGIKVSHLDPESFAYFGSSVAISGDVAVVGAFYDDDGVYSSGSAYVFKRDGSNWDYEIKLRASDAEPWAYFGHSVSISEDVAVIGASGVGRAYVFRWNGPHWIEEAKLSPSGPAGPSFGHAVSVSGDTIVVTSVGGQAYVYRWNGSTWVEEAMLYPPDVQASDGFGNAVSVSGDVVVIGSYLDDEVEIDSGSAYVYRWNGSTWNQEAKLTASDPDYTLIFGISVSTGGDIAVVGASHNYYGGTVHSDSGSAYVFRWNGSAWNQEAKLTASDASKEDAFGNAVSVTGNVAVIGARGNDEAGINSGSAYVFRWDGSAWNQATKLTASDAGVSDWFGFSVSTTNGLALVGAKYDDSNLDDSGSAYIFRLDASPDCNGNNAPDECDVTDGISQDCDANGIPDECDIAISLSRDCNNNGIPDKCDIAIGTSLDCNVNGVPDECDIIVGSSQDCNTNDVPDECDIAVETSEDCNSNIIPDECEAPDDCNNNGVQDICDLANHDSWDCNANDVPDECDVAAGTSPDCNGNLVPDECDLMEKAKLLAPDTPGDGYLGGCVSIEGQVAVVGAAGTDNSAGAAYVFRYDGLSWTYESTLTALHRDKDDRFGCSVSISGSAILVGASGDDLSADLYRAGSAHVFRWDGSHWQHETMLTASQPWRDDNFGNSVSISGDVAVIGAILDGNNRGSAYVFRWDGASWIQEAELRASDYGDYALFGSSVATSGDVTIIGASGGRGNDDGTGSAYMFRRIGNSWTQEAKLIASDGAVSDYFGCSVSIDGNTAVIGARETASGGSAYVFRWDGSFWTQESRLTASDGVANDLFGYSVSISSDLAVIGAALGDGDFDDSGSAYLYRWNGSAWIEEAKLIPSDSAAYDRFGQSVAANGDVMLIGAVYDDTTTDNSGSAYVFALDASHDCNNNRIPDECDPDEDEDTVPDACDNCPVTANVDQSDLDADGLGDACDDDIDGDGLANSQDNCPTVSNQDQGDRDNDGIGDVCDDDVDGDDWPNGQDNCPAHHNVDQTDGDGDGVGDSCDKCPDTPTGTTVGDAGCPLVPGDLDNDLDVDQSDFGLFQVCYGGADIPQPDPKCALALLDEDVDVDADDFGIFQRCMSGANIPADPSCADG